MVFGDTIPFSQKGVVMKFPWKSKKDEEEIDDSEKEQIVTEISQPSPQYNHSSASENRVDRLEIDIERVKALLSTFSEYRKVNDERLTMFEHFGLPISLE